jgi:hypothetical protein
MDREKYLIEEWIQMQVQKQVNDTLDNIRAEISEYGSICVTYAITEKTKTDEGIDELLTDVLLQAKRQVLDIIDKYKAESEE